MFFKIGALKNFAYFTGRHLCWSLFLIKLQAFQENQNAAILVQVFHENCLNLFGERGWYLENGMILFAFIWTLSVQALIFLFLERFFHFGY